MGPVEAADIGMAFMGEACCRFRAGVSGRLALALQDLAEVRTVEEERTPAGQSWP